MPPNQIGLAFFAVRSGRRENRRRSRKKLVNLTGEKTIRWLNTCSCVSNWTKSNDDDGYGTADDSTRAHQHIRSVGRSGVAERRVLLVHNRSIRCSHALNMDAEHANAIFYL